MINLDSITNENNKKQWKIPDHPYRIIIIGGSGSGKTNALINLINEQNDIDKISCVCKRFEWTNILINPFRSKYFYPKGREQI